MDLTWILPQPEPVTVGARRLLASPLRLVDLARLQGYCKAARPCPLDAAWPAIDAHPAGSELRRRALRDAYLACKRWPARLGSADGRAILATEAGLTFWLAVALGIDNPELSADDLAELAATVTVAQYDRLVRIGYGVAPLDELSRLITPDSFPDHDDEPTNWGQLARSIILETGWTFDQVGQIRLPQLAAFRTDGRAGSGKVEPPPGMGRFAFARRQRQFFGPDRDEDL